MSAASGAARGLNPFAAARFAPGVVPWHGEGSEELGVLLARACVPGACLQVLGSEGTGKSTLLAHLEARARSAGIAVVRFRGRDGVPLGALVDLWRRAPRGTARLVLVDELAELGAPAFAALRVVARLTNAALVVTTHEDRGLPVLARRAVDVTTARHVVRHLVGPGAPAVASPHDVRTTDTLTGLEARLARHRGNLRDVLFELYDEHEQARALAQPRPELAARAAGSLERA